MLNEKNVLQNEIAKYKCNYLNDVPSVENHFLHVSLNIEIFNIL